MMFVIIWRIFGELYRNGIDMVFQFSLYVGWFYGCLYGYEKLIKLNI